MLEESKRIVIKWNFHPRAHTEDGLLVRYVKSQEYHPSHAMKELILKSLRMCWMPFAYRDVGQKSCREIKRAARDAIAALERHADELRAEFGIERRSIPVRYVEARAASRSDEGEDASEQPSPGVSSIFAQTASLELPNTGGL